MAASQVKEIVAVATEAGMTDPAQLVAFSLGFANARRTGGDSSTPTLYYFPIAGRAELIKLTAVVGGVKLNVRNDVPKDKSAYGSPSGVPILEHGDLKMSQSLAIERYIADIS